MSNRPRKKNVDLSYLAGRHIVVIVWKYPGEAHEVRRTVFLYEHDYELLRMVLTGTYTEKDIEDARSRRCYLGPNALATDLTVIGDLSNIHTVQKTGQVTVMPK